MEEKATFVVVGGGIAGVSCVEGLSFLCPKKKIILITSSPLIKIVTNVIPLTKTLTQFDVVEKNIDALITSHPFVSVIQDTVTAFDSERQTVTVKGGKLIHYEKLCICTGARPKLIANDNPYVLGIRDTESVKEFEKRIKDARKIIILGNGGIATEVIHEVEGVEMVWIVKDKHISATFIDPGAAEFFQSQVLKGEAKNEKEVPIIKRLKYRISMETQDGSKDTTGAALGPDWHSNIDICKIRSKRSKVSVEYECEIKKILSNVERSKLSEVALNDIWPVYAELTNGKIIGCDFIVSATGVIPNSSLFANSLELAEDGGIKVDWKLETTVPNVFAAGDVCSASWEYAPHWFQMRLWTQARQMGMYAAKTMTSAVEEEETFQDFCFELFSHVTNFFGFKVVLLGLFNGQKLGGDYELLLRVTKGFEYIKLVMQNGKMQGAVLIGETDLEEMCENLILNQLDLSAYGEDLLNPNIDIEDYFD